jgi:4-diphosphocytidyl-2-C-methyl-D-erythritol kinase
MSQQLVLAAPAKINLSLRVLGKRPDGFHDLRTVLVPITLADELRIEVLDDRTGHLEFTCSDTTLPNDGTNLVVRGLGLLPQPLPGLRVHLEKRVPHGAGLGGGSSDAAAAMAAVNALLPQPLSFTELCAAAAQLGSDVPFFLYGGACRGAGRGEILTPLPEFDLGGQRLLLIKLPFGVPTPWAYKNWLASQELAGVDYAPQMLHGHEVVNDLERPVFEKHFVLAMLKTNLRAHAATTAALMSGSGSTMIAFLRSDLTKEALEELKRDVRGWVGDEVWLQETQLGQ